MLKLAWWLALLTILFCYADRHVPAQDTTTRKEAKVWVNSSSKVYHCPGSRYYGSTKAGKYLLDSQARREGNRPV